MWPLGTRTTWNYGVQIHFVDLEWGLGLKGKWVEMLGGCKMVEKFERRKGSQVLIVYKNVSMK